MVGGVAGFDVAQVPLAVKGRGVTRLGEHVGGRDFGGGQSAILVGEAYIIHAVAYGFPAGYHRRAARRAGRFAVHPRKVDALGGEAVDVRRLPTALLLDEGDADLADRRVVEHDMDDVGRPAVFLAKRGQLGIQVTVFGRPPLAVLRFEDVVLCIVNDFGLVHLRERSLVDDQ